MTIDINELRRLAQAASGGPDGVSLNWIKPLQDFQQKASPAAISELLDRLEAGEKERDDIARQLVQSEQGKRKISEECDALHAKIEATESDAAHQKALAESALRVAEGWERKCAALRAKIEAMEKQEPVGEIVAFGESLHEAAWRGGRLPPLGTNLYALPGAKGEEK